MKELTWAAHLNLQAVILPPPSHNPINYSKIVSKHFNMNPLQQLWITIPLVQVMNRENIDSDGQFKVKDSWEVWNTIRVLCDYNQRLCVVLDINTVDFNDYRIQSDNSIKWYAENVKAIIIHTKYFSTSLSGHPILARQMEKFILKLIESNNKLHIILKGRTKYDDLYKPYLEYLRYLEYVVKNKRESMSFGEKFTSGYSDHLQMPLQPLYDNLDSQTYEVFEMDPIKYSKYETAIKKAIIDLNELQYIKKLKSNNKLDLGADIDNESNQLITVIVFGAGRGPLVAATIRASSESKRSVRIFVVEKNPNAVITLRNRAITEGWFNFDPNKCSGIVNIEIIAGNMMNSLNITDHCADLIVSELLGSFGDNELSPERLDGGQRFLKKGGVSIPSSYTSYISPIFSPKLWSTSRDSNDKKVII